MSAPTSNEQARTTHRAPQEDGPPKGPQAAPERGQDDPYPDLEDTLAALGRGLEGHRAGERCVGWCPVCRAADILRTAATPELRESWSDLQRELLLTARAVADHYLTRDRPTGQSRDTEVQEIPIE